MKYALLLLSLLLYVLPVCAQDATKTKSGGNDDQMLYPIVQPLEASGDLLFTPDGKYLLVGGKQLFEVKTGLLVRQYDRVYNSAFIGDGSEVVGWTYSYPEYQPFQRKINIYSRFT